MKRIKMIFTNPLKGLKLILFYLVTILLIGLTLFLLLTNKEDIFLSYLVYGVTAIFFSYSIYTIVIIFPRLKVIIVNYLESIEFTKKILENYKFRTIVFAVLSFSATLLFALFQAVMGIIELSIWFGSLAFYYIILSLMRGNNLYKIYKREIDEKEKIRLYRYNGYMLILLTFIFSIAVIQMVFREEGFKHIGIMIYVLAIYTFYKITLAIINIFKARRHQDYNIQTIRNINLADALVSIVALQTAMFYSFAQEDINTNMFNAITGGTACILIISIGVIMVVKSKNKTIK